MEADSVQEGMAVKLTSEKVQRLKGASEWHPNWAVEGLVAEVHDNGSIRVALGHDEARKELEVVAGDLDLL